MAELHHPVPFDFIAFEDLVKQKQRQDKASNEEETSTRQATYIEPAVLTPTVPFSYTEYKDLVTKEPTQSQVLTEHKNSTV